MLLLRLVEDNVLGVIPYEGGSKDNAYMIIEHVYCMSMRRGACHSVGRTLSVARTLLPLASIRTLNFINNLSCSGISVMGYLVDILCHRCFFLWIL